MDRVATAGFTLPPSLLTGDVAHEGDARDAGRKGRTRGACSEGLEEGAVGVGGGERRGEAGRDDGGEGAEDGGSRGGEGVPLYVGSERGGVKARSDQKDRSATAPGHVN